MIEWFKVPVLKTGVCKYRGFESHSILLEKARDGFEPSFKDLQSFTLPLCYLANIFLIIMQNKKLFTYKNKIILTNGSSLKIMSIKYNKNYQLNFKILKELNSKKMNLSNSNQLNFLKKIKNDSSI